jgi:carboxylate-amine ligase
MAQWRITPLPRYLKAARSWGAAKTNQIDLGGHVHISHSDPETRIIVAERMAKWAPLIIAMSANSPFDEWGRDTGWASWRTRRRRADPTNPLREHADDLAGAMESFVRNRVGMGPP